MVDTITQSLKGYLTDNLHVLTNDLRQNFREDHRQEGTVALEQTDEPLSIGDRASYYKPIEDTCSGSGVSSKSSHTHNITVLINDSENHNGRPIEAIKNPGNGEPSKAQESRERRSLEGTKAPSENHGPKKPRTDSNNNDRVDLQVDDEILEELDQEHKVATPLGEPISSKLAELVTKYWKYEPSSFSNIKKIEEKHLIPEKCEEICVSKLNREIFFCKDIHPWVKRADKRQSALVKATAAIISVSEKILQAERENYVIKAKEVLSPALDGVILLGHVNHSLNKIRLEKLKPNLSKPNLQQLCDGSNLVATYLLRDDHPKRMKEVKETSRIALTQKPNRTPNYGYSTSTSGPSKTTLSKLIILFQQTTFFSCRPETENSKSPTATPGLQKLNPPMMSNNLSLCDELQAGRLKYYIQSWKTITEDPEILETVTGLKLDIPGGPPSCSTNYNIGFSKDEENAIDDENKKLLAKQVIVKCLHEEGEYISPIFVHPKYDGTYRLILNLKNINNTMLCTF